jgi:hypothetical protein
LIIAIPIAAAKFACAREHNSVAEFPWGLLLLRGRDDGEGRDLQDIFVSYAGGPGAVDEV